MSAMFQQVSRRSRSRSRSRTRSRIHERQPRERHRRGHGQFLSIELSSSSSSSADSSDVSVEELESEYEDCDVWEEFSTIAVTKMVEKGKDDKKEDDGGPKQTQRKVSFGEDKDEGKEKDEGEESLTYVQLAKKLYHTCIDNTFGNSNIVVDPEGNAIYWWMTVVTAAVLYNVWMIIFRITFVEMREDERNRRAFGWIDFVCDIIFFLDFLINFRVAYLEQGLLVRDPWKLAKNYQKKGEFKLDVLSIIPLGTLALIFGEFGEKEIFYIHFDLENDHILIPVLRLPRLLKLHAMETYFVIADTRTSNPNSQRAFKLTMYLGGIIHWIGCFYYMLSEYEGFGLNEWVYPDEGNNSSLVRKYVRIMYWSTVTLTTIGGEGNPQTNAEYIFTGVTFLIGVFLFAAVVGNVGDVISNMNAARQDFIAKMDSIKVYMNHRKVPEQLQSRVKKWSDYAWKRTQALDDNSFLEILPPRLKQDLAIHVHLESLRKVKIFEDCEQGLLCELVLKLRSQIFSPSDFICKKGEVGREMYIINHGKVSVVIEDPVSFQRMTVATLSEGSYFGEISLLKLEGGQNRRTADVVSVGYSELLCLSRKDLMQSLVEYPDAKKVLEQHGRDRMEKNKEAARLQRRKSEANLSVPGQSNDKSSEKDKDKDGGDGGDNDGKSPAVKKANAVVKTVTGMLKGREMSELRHVINELKGFDSLATRNRIQELSQKCDDLKLKLKKRDADLKRALQRISELETRVASKLPKNGKLPHYNHDNRRLNLNVNVRSISLTSLESSGNEDSPGWQIEGFETAFDDSSDLRQDSPRVTTPTSPPRITNGSSTPKQTKTPTTPKKFVLPLRHPREMIVPGISINSDVIQEPSTYTWLTPPIGSRPAQEVESSTHSESDVQSGDPDGQSGDPSAGNKLLSASGQSRSSAASQSGDAASDQGSMLSDASSMDSDF
ncbi:uncharacterized protein [Amphiura filiformis]|uniref:uncharacterized protein n=1 Tax=Amphiura filiformis TaxID=82378 RepID=UPI003B20EF0F